MKRQHVFFLLNTSFFRRLRLYIPGLLCVFMVSQVMAARVKDVAQLDGVSNMQLVGYGLVVGLAGTGDGSRTEFTVQSVANMLQKMGVEVPADKIRLRNVAAVMVTAELPAFTKTGQKIDISISSMGDARSLEGGTLLMTPLQGTDGEFYAVGQGPISVGGSMQADHKNRRRRQKNHVLSGNIPNGAIVQKAMQVANMHTGVLRYILDQADFSSAVAMANAINVVFPQSALAEDASTVAIRVPRTEQQNLMAFIAQTENVDFELSTAAKVILNEKTGTLVSGSDVRISEVAVSHGNVVINIDMEEQVSQPNALSAGRTTSVTQEKVQMAQEEQMPKVKVLPSVTSAGELAQALNTLGVAPRDIISIFQAIKKAGALHAELILM